MSMADLDVSSQIDGGVREPADDNHGGRQAVAVDRSRFPQRASIKADLGRVCSSTRRAFYRMLDDTFGGTIHGTATGDHSRQGSETGDRRGKTGAVFRAAGLITQRGRAAAVLLSADAYERSERERHLLRLLVRGEQEITAVGSGTTWMTYLKRRMQIPCARVSETPRFLANSPAARTIQKLAPWLFKMGARIFDAIASTEPNVRPGMAESRQEEGEFRASCPASPWALAAGAELPSQPAPPRFIKPSNP